MTDLIFELLNGRYILHIPLDGATVRVRGLPEFQAATAAREALAAGRSVSWIGREPLLFSRWRAQGVHNKPLPQVGDPHAPAIERSAPATRRG